MCGRMAYPGDAILAEELVRTRSGFHGKSVMIMVPESVARVIRPGAGEMRSFKPIAP
jgi:hypothetical protein